MPERERIGSGTEEVERYRRAAETALDQLDWCVDYLYRIGKPRIARVVAQNRTHIPDRLRHAPSGSPEEC
jgi:hypothetical protein